MIDLPYNTEATALLIESFLLSTPANAAFTDLIRIFLRLSLSPDTLRNVLIKSLACSSCKFSTIALNNEGILYTEALGSSKSLSTSVSLNISLITLIIYEGLIDSPLSEILE